MELAKRFDQAMFEIYRRADTEIGYRPTVFLNMLYERGGVPTARSLIDAPKLSSWTTHNGTRFSRRTNWRGRGAA